MNENPYSSPELPRQDEPSDGPGEPTDLAQSSALTRFEIAALACKILALWLFAQAAHLLTALAMMLVLLVGGMLSRQGVQWRDLLGVSITGVMPVAMTIVGLFLWLKADWLASRMVVDDPSPITASGLTRESVLTIAIAAVGVLTLADMLRDATKYVVVAVQGDPPFEKWWNSPDFLGLLAGLIFALCLTFGARRVAQLALRSKPVEIDEDASQ